MLRFLSSFAKCTYTLGWLNQPKCSRLRCILGHTKQLHLHPQSNQHKEISCLYTDQLKLIESWIEKRPRKCHSSFSFVAKETETLIVILREVVWYEKKRNFLLKFWLPYLPTVNFSTCPSTHPRSLYSWVSCLTSMSFW